MAEPPLCHFLPTTLSVGRQAGLATRSHFHLSSFMLSQLRVHLVAPFHHVSLSPQQPVVCLPGLPLRNINSAILSQILILECLPYLSLCITCSTPVQAGRAPSSVAPDLGILFAWHSSTHCRGPVKRAECIALRCQAAMRRALRCKEGEAASVQCKMQS